MTNSSMQHTTVRFAGKKKLHATMQLTIAGREQKQRHNLPVVYCGSLFRTQQQAVKKKKIWRMCEAMQIAAHIHSQNTDNKRKVLVQRKRTGSPLYFKILFGCAPGWK
jgi:hypothetical protein